MNASPDCILSIPRALRSHNSIVWIDFELTVTVKNVAGFPNFNKCGTATLAIHNGAVRFTVISDAIASVLVVAESVNWPISCFPAMTKMLSISG